MRKPGAVALLLMALAACGDGTTAPVDGLVAGARSTELIEGRSTQLTAVLDGKTVDPANVQWLSRDPFTIEVTGTTARGRAPGVAWVVARVGNAVDSVRIAVSFSALSLNNVGVRIAEGEVDERFTLGGAALLFELPSAQLRTIVHATGARGADGTPSDTTLSLFVRGAPGTELRTLPPLTVKEEPDGSYGFYGDEGLLVHIAEEGEGFYALRFYVAVTDSPLEFTTVELPAEVGLDHGVLAGRTSFEAAGFRLVFPEGGVPYLEQLGQTTTRIYVEFRSDFYRVPVPRTFVTLTGSYAGSQYVGGRARVANDSLTMQWSTLFNYQQPDERIVDGTITIPTLALGTFDFSTAQAALGLDFSIFVRTVPGANSGTSELESSATANSGTITITTYVAPTDRAYGLVEGTFTATLDFGTGSERTGTIEGTFHVPVDPLLGPPVRSAIGRTRAAFLTP